MNVSALHRRIHAAAAPAVRAGRVIVDPVPVSGDERWGLSLVALPPAAVVFRLMDAAQLLADRMANPHVVYRADHLHVTVRSLEGFASDVPRSVIDQYRARLESVLTDVGAIAVQMRGLFLTPTGVVACGVPDQSLANVRARLAVDAQRHGWVQVPGADAGRVRDTAHASLMVFRAGDEREDLLVDAVEALQEVEFGMLQVDRLALVTYVVSDDSIRLVEREWLTL